MRPDMLKTKTKLKTMKSLPKCGRDRWFTAECFYHIYTPKEATKQALLKYDTLHFNEMKPRGTLLLLEPLSINALVFAFVQKSLWSHPWLFSWGWDKTMLSVREKITPHCWHAHPWQRECSLSMYGFFHRNVTAERSMPKEIQISWWSSIIDLELDHLSQQYIVIN